MEETNIEIKEEIGGKSIWKSGRSIWLACAYLATAVLSVLFIFARLAASQGEAVLAETVYSIKTFTQNGSPVVSVNAGLANALFIGSSGIMLLLAVATVVLPFAKKQKTVFIVRLSLWIAQGLLFATAYPPLMAALTQYLLVFEGKITAFLSFAYLIPLLPLGIVSFDILHSFRWKKRKLNLFMYAYPLIILLCAGVFAMPVFTSESVFTMLAPQGFRTLFGENGARTALLVMTCAVLSVIAFAIHITGRISGQNKMPALKRIIAWGNVCVPSAFVIIFVYCAAGVITHFANAFQLVQSGDAGNVRGGAFAMLILPIFAGAVFAADGVKAWQKIQSKRQSKEPDGHFGSIIVMITAFYTVFAAAFFLCISVPYASQNIGGFANGFYLLNYKNVSYDMIEQLVPDNTPLYLFAVLLLTAALICLASNIVWKEKFLTKIKSAQTICFSVKPVLAVVVTAVFIAAYKFIAIYQKALQSNLSASELATSINFVPVTLKIMSIGFLVVVWLDVLLSFRAYVLVRKRKQKTKGTPAKI